MYEGGISPHHMCDYGKFVFITIKDSKKITFCYTFLYKMKIAIKIQ